jgi:hypothetical protein
MCVSSLSKDKFVCILCLPFPPLFKLLIAPPISTAVHETDFNRSCFSLRLNELSNEPTGKLAEKIISLEYTLEEKDRAISVLRQAIDHQRKLSANFSIRFQVNCCFRLAHMMLGVNNLAGTVKMIMICMNDG